MKNISIWKDSAKALKSNKKLPASMKVDVLIIGAGITGLSTAFYLNNSNKKVVVIEKNNIGNGVTASSTGKLTINQDVMYSKIEHVLGYETAYKYYKSQKCALKLIDTIICNNQLDCDYMDSPSITFMENTDGILDLEKEENFYKRAKIKYQKVKKLKNSLPITDGIMVNHMKVFHPLKFLYELKRIVNNIPIYENVVALEIIKTCGIYKVITDKGDIFSKKIVVATHYPFFIKPAFIPFRTYIEKSYLLAAKLDQTFDFNAINCGKKVISMRYYNDHMVMANYSKKTTNKDNYKTYFSASKKKFSNHFKGTVDYMWSNHDIMTNDHMPYIGEVERNLYLATGYNKWGLATGVLAGKIISDSILNKKNQYKDLFSFERSGGLTKILIAFNHNVSNITTYINMKLQKPHLSRITKGKYNNKKTMTYKEGKSEYTVYSTCPHMGCGLLFNENDKTWDCPCHGSRFDLRGKSIMGPSKYSISIK